MTELTNRYEVKFINNFIELDEPLVIRFVADNPEDVKALISCIHAFYSGDPCECFINGEQAVLEGDWGLELPPNKA